jgi:hypothetical protein
MRNRQIDSAPREHAPREAQSAFDFWSGKVPLRPIQRIGILLLNVLPLLVVIFIWARVIPILKGAPTLVLYLFVPIILIWAVIVLATGRMVWAALTAPSQKDE